MVSAMDINKKKLGFNRKNFVEGILNTDFNGNIKECAIQLQINRGYLHDLIYDTSKDAGTTTLTKIYQYCKQTNKNPETYIFRN